MPCVPCYDGCKDGSLKEGVIQLVQKVNRLAMRRVFAISIFCLSTVLIEAYAQAHYSTTTTAVEPTPERVLAYPASLVQAIPTQISQSVSWIEIDLAA